MAEITTLMDIEADAVRIVDIVNPDNRLVIPLGMLKRTYEHFLWLRSTPQPPTESTAKFYGYSIQCSVAPFSAETASRMFDMKIKPNNANLPAVEVHTPVVVVGHVSVSPTGDMADAVPVVYPRNYVTKGLPLNHDDDALFAFMEKLDEAGVPREWLVEDMRKLDLIPPGGDPWRWYDDVKLVKEV